MINESKKKDPRFWKKWKECGALEGVIEARNRSLFRRLHENIGKDVEIEYLEFWSENSIKWKKKGKLRNVDEIHKYLEISDVGGVPFLGADCAITIIVDQNGTTLYENVLVTPEYGWFGRRIGIETLTFGAKSTLKHHRGILLSVNDSNRSAKEELYERIKKTVKQYAEGLTKYEKI